MRDNVTYRDVVSAIEEIAPPRWAESWDNCGLLLGAPETPVRGILICLDLSERVIEEAKELGANLIVSHHPLIHTPLKQLTGQDRTSRLALMCLEAGLGFIAAHTNYDAAPEGVSYQLAKCLGLQSIHPLEARRSGKVKLVTFVPSDYVDSVSTSLFDAGAGWIGDYSYCSYRSEGTGTFLPSRKAEPFVGIPGELNQVQEVRIETVIQEEHVDRAVRALRCAHPYEEMTHDVMPLLNHSAFAGIGAVGELPKPMDEQEFLHHVKETLRVPFLRHSAPLGSPIRRVAVCGGSGMPYLTNALQTRATAYVTGDVKYHDFQRAEGHLLLVDAGHYETEHVALEYLRYALCEKFSTFASAISTREVSSLHYFA